jgi:hypothetical protein
MVNSFDYSTGAKPPDGACFQMSDAEFHDVLRGWKHPPPLGEELIRSEGVKPFTKERQTFVRREPVRPPDAPEPGAVRSPKLWHLPWIDVGEVYAFHFDLLAMLVLGWTREYAAGEVSAAHVHGPENVNHWFVLFPERVTAAVAAIPDAQIPELASRWAASDGANPIEKAEELLRLLVSFMRSAEDSGRRVYFWGSR